MYEQPRYWKPTATLAKWTCGVLVVQAMLNVTCAFLASEEADRWLRVHEVLRTTNGGDSVFGNRVQDAMNGPNSTWFTLAQYAFTASFVLLIIWSHRSAKNALALGRTGARQTPGWVIAGWLIPIVNIVLPYQTVSDLWRSTAPDAPHGDGWRAARPSGRVIAWWLAFQVFNSGYFFVIGLMLTGDWSVSQAKPWFAATHAGIALAALLGAWVVWDVTQRQTRQQELNPAPVRQPVPGGQYGQYGASQYGQYGQYGASQYGQYGQYGASQYGQYGQYGAQPIVRGPNGMPIPGWYADPGGVFEFRYWDGVAWTEHVSRGGVASIAPAAVTAPSLPVLAQPAHAVAPDWFPDPSGRHQWRFWGGDDWTPHVSDDGVHSDDPLGAPAAPPDPDDVIPTSDAGDPDHPA
ncbi:MAG: DUF4328 domain-containing protein [Acidimicrobiia bacterium]